MSSIVLEIQWPTGNWWFILTVWNHSSNLHRHRTSPQETLVPPQKQKSKAKKQHKTLHHLIMIKVIGHMVPFYHRKTWHQLPLYLYPLLPLQIWPPSACQNIVPTTPSIPTAPHSPVEAALRQSFPIRPHSPPTWAYLPIWPTLPQAPPPLNHHPRRAFPIALLHNSQWKFTQAQKCHKSSSAFSSARRTKFKNSTWINASSTRSGTPIEILFAKGCHSLQLTQHWEAKVKYKTHLNQNRLYLFNRKRTKDHEKKANEKITNFF